MASADINTNSVVVVMCMPENIIADQSWFVIKYAIDQPIKKKKSPREYSCNAEFAFVKDITE